MVKLYSIGCPMCNVLKKKLDSKHIEYELIASTEEMEALGLTRVPALMIDDRLLLQADAIKWVNEQ